jgi:hypothetical protein
MSPMPPIVPTVTPAPSSGTVSSALALLPPTPKVYSDTMGAGRPSPYTKLRSASTVLASCSFDKSSLKRPAFLKSDLVKLIDCASGDYDVWLPARPEVLERMLKLYYQRYFTVIPGGFESPTGDRADVRAAAAAGEELCRDLLRDGIAEAPKLARVLARIRKARTDNAGEDLVFMIHAIDQHAVPASAAAISLTIERRRLKLDEESIAAFLEDLINMCASHFDESEVRRKFVVAVSIAMDEAEQLGTYSSSKIDHVRDNFLSDDAVLPASNDALREKLERTSSTNKAWQRTGAAPGPSRGAKEARTHEAWPQQQQPSYSPPQPSPPQQHAPSVPSAPSTPPQSQQPPALHEQFQQQASISNEAASYYGSAAYPSPGGRGYGFSKGGHKGGYQSQGYGGRGFDSGKGKGKGFGAPKDPNSPTKFYNFAKIIATGLIWPTDTRLFWNNPVRINADGSGDGLYGCSCPLCGKSKKREFEYEAFKTEFGKYPGTGPDCVAQPPDVAIFHRGLGCREGGWEVARYVRDHADAPDCMKCYMTEGELAEFKAVVPS